MNQSIAGIVDLLFKDVVVNEETTALHEELMNNCQDRYADLVSHGFTEAEALDAVVESLKGMKDVLNEYPRKDAAPAEEAKPEAQPEPAAGPSPDAHAAAEAPGPDDFTFDPAAVTVLHTSLVEQDVTVLPSGDQLIHVRCDDHGAVLCSLENGRLSVRKNPDFHGNAPADTGFNLNDISLQSIFNLMGRAIKSVTQYFGASAPVRIEVPEGGLNRLELDSRSGDITVDRVFAPEISAHTASGDIRLSPESDGSADCLSVGTASGDLKVRANVRDAELSSVSGDITLQGRMDCVRLKSVSGDVCMEGSLTEADISSVSGDVELTLVEDTARRINMRSTSGDASIRLPLLTTAVHAVYSTRSGDVSCEYQDAGPDARTQIHMTSVSGDIRIF